tara:strand:- start:269 stop:403 length:135 start_codon:yes stop_codon:yes gene_type:complete
MDIIGILAGGFAVCAYIPNAKDTPISVINDLIIFITFLLQTQVW